MHDRPHREWAGGVFEERRFFTQLGEVHRDGKVAGGGGVDDALEGGAFDGVRSVWREADGEAVGFVGAVGGGAEELVLALAHLSEANDFAKADGSEVFGGESLAGNCAVARDVSDAGDAGAEGFLNACLYGGDDGGLYVVGSGVIAHQERHPVGERGGTLNGGALIAKFQMRVGIDEAGKHDAGDVVLRDVSELCVEIVSGSDGEDFSRGDGDASAFQNGFAVTFHGDYGVGEDQVDLVGWGGRRHQ